MLEDAVVAEEGLRVGKVYAIKQLDEGILIDGHAVFLFLEVYRHDPTSHKIPDTLYVLQQGQLGYPTSSAKCRWLWFGFPTSVFAPYVFTQSGSFYVICEGPSPAKSSQSEGEVAPGIETYTLPLNSLLDTRNIHCSRLFQEDSDLDNGFLPTAAVHWDTNFIIQGQADRSSQVDNH